MKLVQITSHPEWSQTKREHLVSARDGHSFWKDDFAYVFTREEIESIKQTSLQLYQMLFELVDDIIKKGRFAELGILREHVPFIVDSWQREVPSLATRLLFSLKDGQLRLVGCEPEWSAGLLETALQSKWLELHRPGFAQFNSIENLLVDYWEWYKSKHQMDQETLYFTSHPRDRSELNYVQVCADLAGLRTQFLRLEEMGWNGQCFVDGQNTPLRHIYKLASWRSIFGSSYAGYLAQVQVQWCEPPWKVLFANERFLADLYRLFPEHPSLIPSFPIADGSLASTMPEHFQTKQTLHAWIIGEIPAGLLVTEKDDDGQDLLVGHWVE